MTNLIDRWSREREPQHPYLRAMLKHGQLFVGRPMVWSDYVGEGTSIQAAGLDPCWANLGPRRWDLADVVTLARGDERDEIWALDAISNWERCDQLVLGDVEISVKLGENALRLLRALPEFEPWLAAEAARLDAYHQSLTPT